MHQTEEALQRLLLGFPANAGAVIDSSDKFDAGFFKGLLTDVSVLIVA
jgi:hypothetical protein